VSSGPPGHGQVSPDGKWWWDGARWLPMPTSGAHEPTLSPPAMLIPQGAPPPASVFVYGPRTNSAAVASLVLGVISWFLCPFIGGILAVVFGHVARGQIRRSGESGGGLAVAGLILGYLHLVAVVVFVFIWLVILGGTLATIGIIGNLPTPTP
jgi:Domain of unknown function (DUF4190)